ncbi:MAG: GntR family transcriptional regulator [Actinomycetota bacterium]
MPPGHEVRLTRVEVIAAHRDVAQWLEIEEGAEVVVRRRELWIESEPMQLWDAYYPAHLVAGTDLARPGFVSSGSYAALERLGHPPIRADEEITARMPDPTEAVALHISQGVPILHIVRVTRDRDNHPLFAFVIIAPGDRNAFVYADLPLVGPLGDPPTPTPL